MADNYMNRGFVTDAQAMARGQRVPVRRAVLDTQWGPAPAGWDGKIINGYPSFMLGGAAPVDPSGGLLNPMPLPAAVEPAVAVAARALPVGVKPPGGLVNPFQLKSPSQIAAAGRALNAGQQYKRWGR